MADCLETQFHSVAETFGGPKPIPSCMPGEVRPNDELYSPTQGASEYSEPPVLVLTLRSHQKEAVCRDLATTDETGAVVAEPYGPPSIVPDGALATTLPLDDAATLPDAVLEHIGRIDGHAVLSMMFHENEDMAAEDVMSLLNIGATDATSILRTMREAQQDLDSTAEVIARTGLDCVWYNTIQSAECAQDPEGNAAATEALVQGAVAKSVVPAGTVSSAVSLEDANARAKAIAEAGLNCLFASETVTVDCRDTERPGFPAEGGTEEVPNSTEGYNGRPPQRGSVQVPVAAFTSRVSVAEATDTARAYGWSQLSCYYINERVYKQCGLSSARARGLSPEATDPAEAVPSVSQGQYVTIEAGTIVSELSTADATATADAIALASLECCFVNKTIERSCDVIYYRTEDGTELEVKAKDTPDYVSHTVIQEGTIITCVDDYAAIKGEPYQPDSSSQNAQAKRYADAQAEETAALSLDCLYCNVRVLPKCVPQWVVEAVTTGVMLPDGSVYRPELPLDLDTLIDPSTGNKVDTSTWAADFTLGTPEDAYCSSRFTEAQDVAELGGSTKVTTNDGCQFANDLMVVACEAVDPFNPGLPAEHGKWHRRRKSNGDPYWFYVSKPADTGLAKESFPVAGSTAEVAAGTFTYVSSQVPGTAPRMILINGVEVPNPEYNYDRNAALTKDYANGSAKATALAMLDCFYTNHRVVTYCSATTKPCRDVTGNTSDPWLRNMPVWTIGPGKSEVQLTSESSTFLNPAVVEAGTVRSYESLLDAYMSAKAMAEAMLLCLYSNKEQRCACSGGQQLNAGIVPAGEIVASSAEEANSVANKMACGMVACITLPPIPDPGDRIYCNKEEHVGRCVDPEARLLNRGIVPPGTVCAASQSAAEEAAGALAVASTVCVSAGDFVGPQGPPGTCGGGCYGVYA